MKYVKFQCPALMKMIGGSGCSGDKWICEILKVNTF